MCTAIRLATYQRVVQQQGKKVQRRAFRPGDLVLKRTFNEGKILPNWEGPFKVALKSVNGGAYQLQKMDGSMIARPWNVSHLKVYYY